MREKEEEEEEEEGMMRMAKRLREVGEVLLLIWQGGVEKGEGLVSCVLRVVVVVVVCGVK